MVHMYLRTVCLLNSNPAERRPNVQSARTPDRHSCKEIFNVTALVRMYSIAIYFHEFSKSRLKRFICIILILGGALN